MSRRAKHPDPPSGCPVRLVRPRTYCGTIYGAERIVLVSMPIMLRGGVGRRELWRIPGHNGWGDQLHSSVYHANLLDLVELLTPEGPASESAERGPGCGSSKQLYHGGSLKEQLADEEVAGKIRDAFPGISLADIKLSRTLWLPEPESEPHV